MRRSFFIALSMMLMVSLSPMNSFAQPADELDEEDFLQQPTPGAQERSAPVSQQYPERDEDHPQWNQRRTHSCTGFFCETLESATPIVLPRTYKTTPERDFPYCRHYALLSTPNALAEGGEEALLRFLITAPILALTRGALGQDDTAAITNGVLGGAGAGAGGFANGIEGTRRSLYRAYYVCLRTLGYPVLPFGR